MRLIPVTCLAFAVAACEAQTPAPLVADYGKLHDALVAKAALSFGPELKIQSKSLRIALHRRFVDSTVSRTADTQGIQIEYGTSTSVQVGPPGQIALEPLSALN